MLSVMCGAYYEPGWREGRQRGGPGAASNCDTAAWGGCSTHHTTQHPVSRYHRFYSILHSRLVGEVGWSEKVRPAPAQPVAELIVTTRLPPAAAHCRPADQAGSYQHKPPRPENKKFSLVKGSTHFLVCDAVFSATISAM